MEDFLDTDGLPRISIGTIHALSTNWNRGFLGSEDKGTATGAGLAGRGRGLPAGFAELRYLFLFQEDVSAAPCSLFPMDRPFVLGTLLQAYLESQLIFVPKSSSLTHFF
jgi:hypothetical protein